MPTITLKLREILDAVPTLTKLTSHKFPASVAFDLASLIKKLQVELDLYETTRIDLIKQYGETVPVMVKAEDSDEMVPTGQSRVQVKGEYLELFTQEVNSLLNKELEFTGVRLIPLSALDNLEDISVDEMRTLLPMIDAGQG